MKKLICVVILSFIATTSQAGVNCSNYSKVKFSSKMISKSIKGSVADVEYGLLMKSIEMKNENLTFKDLVGLECSKDNKNGLINALRGFKGYVNSLPEPVLTCETRKSVTVKKLAKVSHVSVSHVSVFLDRVRARGKRLGMNFSSMSDNAVLKVYMNQTCRHNSNKISQVIKDVRK